MLWDKASQHLVFCEKHELNTNENHEIGKEKFRGYFFIDSNEFTEKYNLGVMFLFPFIHLRSFIVKVIHPFYNKNSVYNYYAQIQTKSPEWTNFSALIKCKIHIFIHPYIKFASKSANDYTWLRSADYLKRKRCFPIKTNFLEASDKLSSRELFNWAN